MSEGSQSGNRPFKALQLEGLFAPGNLLQLTSFQDAVFMLWQATKHRPLLHRNGCEKVQV